MIENSFYSKEFHGDYEIAELGDLVLEEGETLRGCKLAYRTFGELNAEKSNAILVTTWYSGTSKIMEDVYIGAGHALDPETFFIIVVNQIGSGLSSSPHNTPAPQDMARFPKVRIGDDVVAQHRLLTEKFGITNLALIMGGSMGAQQTYEWTVRYPDMVKRAAPIAGTAKNSPHDFLYTKTLLDTITCDPAWKKGWYEKGTDVRRGLERHAEMWGVMGWSTEFYQQKRWEHPDIGMSSVEDFLKSVMVGYFAVMDPNDLLCMGWKWQRGDVSRHAEGDLSAALARVTAKTFVMPISTDMIFPVKDCAEECALIEGAELRVLETVEGHFALNGFDPSYIIQVDKYLSELLAIEV